MRQRRKLKKAIAIVGEGPTEWFYFEYIRKDRRYTFTLKPELPGHSDFSALFRKAKDLVNQSYDLVFCVLDLDTIAQNTQRLQTFKNECKRLPKRIIPITSYPCIEFWFLLHFHAYPKTRVFQTCDEVLRELHRFIPDYMKNQKFLESLTCFKAMEKDGQYDRALSNGTNILHQVKMDTKPFQRSFSEVGEMLQYVEQCKLCDFRKDCLSCEKKLKTLYPSKS
jgi:hypothetical protein